MSRLVSLPLVIAIAVALIPFEATAQNAPPPPIAIAVNAATVTGTGLTPGGSVVILAGWWLTSYGQSELTNTWRAGTADGSGSFSATFRTPVPEGALLIALDAATGRSAAIDAGEPRFKRVAIPEQRFRRAANRDVDSIASPHDAALIVVMRRGTGIWLQRAGDGGNTDGDQQSDGFIVTVPAAMRPLAGSPAPPDKIKPKDVVLVIDAIAGIFASTEVEE